METSRSRLGAFVFAMIFIAAMFLLLADNYSLR